jgi:hypothetical protein
VENFVCLKITKQQQEFYNGAVFVLAKRLTGRRVLFPFAPQKGNKI